MPLVYETIEALVRVELAAMSPDEMAVGNVSACFFMSVCFWRCADPLPHNVPAMQAAPTIVQASLGDAAGSNAFTLDGLKEELKK